MKAYILSLNKDADLTQQWDYGFLKDFLEGNLWKPANWEDFEIIKCDKLPKADRAIVAIPARHHRDLAAQINKELNKIGTVVLFLMGDEEADFPIEELKHIKLYIWVQNPHMDRHEEYDRIGTGYPTHMKQYLPEEFLKVKDLFFSGQITHNRREELADAIDLIDFDYEFNKTGGFTQGYEHKEYYQKLSQAKFAPAPSGAVVPDSFRLFEALECMAIAIADQKTPKGIEMEYWDWLFKEITPFPKTANWFEMNNIMKSIDYDWLIEKQTAWWIRWKRNFAYKVMGQLNGN